MNVARYKLSLACFFLTQVFGPSGRAQKLIAKVAPVTTATAAGRLLDQASFGPTETDIQRVQQLGLSSYLAQQFAMPVTTLPQFAFNVPAPCDSQETCWGSVWWNAALNASDQLRQRVAFALSHIFVVSTNTVGGYAMVAYYNLLLHDAFTNWRQLMQDVTLSPSMGIYLNMVNSGAAAQGQIVNENFARENLQLFNLGTVLLNQDGTPRKDASGAPVPAYTQAQVQAFARAFTGWTYPVTGPAKAAAFNSGMQIYAAPMQPVETQHDMRSKLLLDGVTLAAGQTAEQDLQDALNNIFESSNLPPFVCRQLIQHLVTSNPSSGYVSRVAQVFINNGKGVRGDLKAVVTAILLDTEARSGDVNSNFDGGHLREPLLSMTAALRIIPFTPTDQTDPWGYWSVSLASSPAGESPMQAPSVFGYFPPGYVVPGTTLPGPEFGIENVAAVSSRKVMVDQVLAGNLENMTPGLPTDSELNTLAANPAALVQWMSLVLMHNRMSQRMQDIVINAVTPLSDPKQRVRIALEIVLTSSQYKVIH